MNKPGLNVRVCIILAAAAVCGAAFAGSARGAGQIVQVKYPASTIAGELSIGVTYTLWIPDGVSKLRGIIVHQHGAGTTASKEGSTAAYDLHWQALAKKWDCALLGPTYHVLNEKTDLTPGGSEHWFDPRRGSEKTFLKALGELAAKSGHPELTTVPWALWGHSGGGIWADVMSTLHADRVAAIWFRSGTAAMFRTREEFPQPQVPAAVYAIPSMVNPGIKEKNPAIPDVKGKEKGVWWGNLATFREYRAKGAPIGFAPDPRTGHECGDSRYLAIPFLDACLAMRLPDKGSKDQTLKPVDMSEAWLAPLMGDTAVPAADYKGKAEEAVWLPNEAVAKAWMEYVKTGAVSDTSPPPAPYNVRVWPRGAKGEGGAEIVWSAEADFESGIREFIVLRDGKELAKVPQKPVGKFGRPLFQSMTYHDTPAQPLPEMRYFDPSGQAGKHNYEIISVNSVGLKSEPSVKTSSYPRINMSPWYKADATWPKRPKSISWGPMSGVAVDAQDNVWILARNDPPVQVYQPDGKFLRAWGEGLLDTPHQLKLDRHGNVWLADSGNHVILQCTPQGNVIRTLGTRGVAGCDESHFNRPADMVVTPDGDVFVADGYGNARVVHFDKNGKFVKAWGQLGTAPGEFSLPHAIALDSKGRLYVADRNNIRIQVFDQAGKFLDQWQNIVVPCAFWMTKDDELWVCGSSPMPWRADDKVLGYPPVDQLFMKFNTSGKLLQLWSVPKGEDGKEKLGELNWAHGIALDSQGNIYAVDIKGKRAQKFVPQEKTRMSAGLQSAPSDKAAPRKDTPQQGPAESGKPTFDKSSPFYFDGAISRQTLENYLDRAITMGYFLVPGQPERYQFPYRDDDVRMIHNIGAKFIGRAIYRWSEESKLGEPAFLEHAKKLVERVHAVDPEVIFQGCLFENVSADVNKLKIPAWVFTDFGLPAEDRTFSRAEIIKRSGKGAGRGGVPIINNLETRLWFYYLAAAYINIGCEALHLGQVGLIGAEDRGLKVYAEFLAKVRSYAKQHARRHMVLLDGHVPSGGMIKDGTSLLDFNSFPMRIKAVAGKPHIPGKPQEAILEVGHLDAIFKRSKGCISPSGWKCESLPYLIEFDNFGRGPSPNVADPKSMFCWGWDEISWFAQQPQEYRNQWLQYAHDWIKRTDPNGHLQMPGIRMLTCPNETLRSYFANTKSATCPVGYSQEEIIKTIWIKNAPISVKGDAPISLYGGGAASRDDGVKKQGGDSFRWTGSGQITWKVQIDRAGDYEVALNHAAEPGAVGQHLQVSSGNSMVEYKLALTKGVFGVKSYEMTSLKGRLRLEAGTHMITLSIPDAPKALTVLQFRSLELIPVAANAAVEAERQEARRARASTEWLAKTGYGLMFHWTSQSIGKDGTHKPYAQAVDDFDVKRFADMVEETGAGYVIFTIGHAQSYCPAPLKAWEKYHPGKTTARDLIAEMADALSAKGIKLMCYLNAASLTKYPKASEEEFSRIMTEVVTEFGEHYKEKVAGYWFDCCYQAKEKYPGFSFREFFKTCKAGNPNRIVALNSWIYPNVSEWQEYWAGETANPVGLPLKGTTQENGPGAGLRYHALLIMEPYWVQQKVEMPRPQFTAQKLGDYIAQCKANGGAVTINLGIYQDGTVDTHAVDVLKEVRRRIRKEQE